MLIRLWIGSSQRSVRGYPRRRGGRQVGRSFSKTEFCVGVYNMHAMERAFGSFWVFLSYRTMKDYRFDTATMLPRVGVSQKTRRPCHEDTICGQVKLCRGREEIHAREVTLQVYAVKFDDLSAVSLETRYEPSIPPGLKIRYRHTLFDTKYI